jgi:hypothetical protein
MMADWMIIDCLPALPALPLESLGHASNASEEVEVEVEDDLDDEGVE